MVETKIKGVFLSKMSYLSSFEKNQLFPQIW